MNEHSPSLLGLRTVIYAAPDIERAKAWYANALGIEPYFDEPYYVGFNIGGFELGLDPDAEATGDGGATAYWGVKNADDALAALLGAGATASKPVSDVGGGIRVASVLDPFGNRLGIIENPHFDLTKLR